MRSIAKAVFTVMLLLAVAPMNVGAQTVGATSGEITVTNESGFELYLTVGGYDKGKLEPGYSKTFNVPIGGHRVEARTDSKYDKRAYYDFVLSSTYPYDWWYIKNSDLN